MLIKKIFKQSAKQVSQVALGFSLCVSAFAAPLPSVELSYLGAGFAPYQTSSISKYAPSSDNLAGGMQGVYTGAFDMKVSNSSSPLFSNGQSILAWCVDISQSLATTGKKVYTVDGSFDTNSSFGNHGVTVSKITDIQKLFNQHYSELLGATTNATRSLLSAAMQLAVWEIVAENTLPGNYSLDTGKFQATNNANATAKANDWLGHLSSSSNTGNYRIVILNNGAQQDLITVSAVPLPGAALLFLSALGFGRLAKRRSEKLVA